MWALWHSLPAASCPAYIMASTANHIYKNYTGRWFVPMKLAYSDGHGPLAEIIETSDLYHWNRMHDCIRESQIPLTALETIPRQHVRQLWTFRRLSHFPWTVHVRRAADEVLHRPVLGIAPRLPLHPRRCHLRCKSSHFFGIEGHSHANHLMLIHVFQVPLSGVPATWKVRRLGQLTPDFPRAHTVGSDFATYGLADGIPLCSRGLSLLTGYHKRYEPRNILKAIGQRLPAISGPEKCLADHLQLPTRSWHLPLLRDISA